MATSMQRVKATTTESKQTPVLLQPPRQTWADFKALHQRAFYLAIERLVQTPLATFLTVLVIGVALALPSFLFLFLDNLEGAAQGLNPGAQISLYLKPGIANTEARQILARVTADSRIQSAKYISPEQGLNEFAKAAGFGDLLAELPVNPLPGVIVIQPYSHVLRGEEYQLLTQDMSHIPEVAQVRVDMLWVQRLQAFIHLADRTVFAFSILLGFAVFLVIGNTLRVMVQTYHEEIEVMKLIGATHRYVLRPFIYAGVLCGLWGAVLAMLFVGGLVISLQTPIHYLTSLYQTDFHLHGLSLSHLSFLLAIGILLGVISTQLSVRRYLFTIRPE